MEEARDLIDLLAARVELAHEGNRIRHLMLSVCEGINAAGNRAYAEVLEIGRKCVNGKCGPEQLKEARIQVVHERDRNRLTSPSLEAAFRTVRYVLELPETPISDWYDVLWNFVADAERAGFTDESFAKLLKESFPELES
jgi:hypothetical protein